MKIPHVIVSLALLASSAIALPGRGLPNRALVPRQQSSSVLPPSEDPWYSAPSNYTSASPGQVLKIRPAPGNASSIYSNASAIYNVLYRTTDSQYKPTWAVTTLFIPKTRTVDALISYQIPYDSADVDSSPSYSLYNGDYATLLNAALTLGVVINIPDFEGPNASFTAGVISGYATLDSIRASLKANVGLTNNTKYVMWGYSGGALASEWAAELQVQYAPEMNFSGAALGGLTPNITSVFVSVTGTPDAGLIPAGILGLATQYPDLLALIKSELKPNGTYNGTTFLNAYNQSLGETITTFYNQSVQEYFQTGVGLLQSPAAQRAINRDGIMGYHGVPQMPLYVYKAIGDQISPINETDALVDRFCGVGVSIQYDRNTIGDHGQEFVNGNAAAAQFLFSVLTGTYNMTGCQVRNVTINATQATF